MNEYQIGNGGLISLYYSKYKTPSQRFSYYAPFNVTSQRDNIHHIIYWNSSYRYHSPIVETETQYNITFTFPYNPIIRKIQFKTRKDTRFPLKYFIYATHPYGEEFLLYHQTEPICTIRNSYDCIQDSEYMINLPREKHFPLRSITIGNDGKDTANSYSNTIGAIEFFGSEYSEVITCAANDRYFINYFLVVAVIIII